VRAGGAPSQRWGGRIAEALVALETMPGMRWFLARSWIVVAAGSITDVDTPPTRCTTSTSASTTWCAPGLRAELKDPARHKIDRELTRTIDSSHFSSTLEAVIGGVPGRVGCGSVSGHPERSNVPVCP